MQQITPPPGQRPVRIQSEILTMCLYQKPRDIASLFKRRKHLRQAVTLTGFGSRAFQQGVENAQKVYQGFFNALSSGKLEEWQTTMFEGIPAIDISTRYFTERRNAPNEVPVDFGENVDPEGIMAYIQGEDFIHTQDNFVEYLEIDTVSNGKTK